jgi:hypothetical protein
LSKFPYICLLLRALLVSSSLLHKVWTWWEYWKCGTDIETPSCQILQHFRWTICSSPRLVDNLSTMKSVPHHNLAQKFRKCMAPSQIIPFKIVWMSISHWILRSWSMHSLWSWNK